MNVTVTTDKMGRSVALIPDAAAEALRTYSDEGWSDVADFNVGTSRRFGPGHPAHTLATDYLTSLPEGERAPTFIVGESGWDARTCWWSDRFPNLNVPTIVRAHNGTVYFTG